MYVWPIEPFDWIDSYGHWSAFFICESSQPNKHDANYYETDYAANVKQHSSAVSKICPHKIVRENLCYAIKSGCYCLVKVKQSWIDSERYCKAQGMQLVSIETKEEQDQLNELLAGEARTWWTSGADLDAEGSWIWSASGLPFNYTFWGNRQPDGGSVQNVMQIKRMKDGFRWNDYPSYKNEYSVCEY